MWQLPVLQVIRMFTSEKLIQYFSSKILRKKSVRNMQSIFLLKKIDIKYTATQPAQPQYYVAV